MELPSELIEQKLTMKQLIYIELKKADHPMHEKELCKLINHPLGGAANRALRELRESGLIEKGRCSGCDITFVYSIKGKKPQKQKHSKKKHARSNS